MKASDISTGRNKADNAIDTALERVVMLWSLGDWSALIAITEQCNILQQSKLAVYKIAALLQCGEVEQAKVMLATVDFTDAQHNLLSRLLVSGVLNSIGKAKACNYEHQQAQQLFKQSLAVGLDYAATVTMYEARTATQLAQLGLPHIQQMPKTNDLLPDISHFLQSAKAFFQQEPVFDLALADYYQRAQSFEQAIVHWQQVSAILEKDTPQPYYERLKDAYRQVKGFPLGAVEQEALKGDIDKHKLLAIIHSKLSPEFYFEIGVQTGKSLALAKCEALGIDPMPLINVALGSNAKVISASSDAFFEQKSDVLLTKTIDLAFIDGMHLFEYALRDFMNTERHAKPHSLIVIDDIYPGHADQAKRNRCTRAWTGDVWKVKAVLQQYRPDLVILAIDAYPTGLLIITGLDPNNTVLQDNYTEIVHKFISYETVPADIMQRSDAVSGSSEQIHKLIDLAKESKKQGFGATAIQNKWSECDVQNLGW